MHYSALRDRTDSHEHLQVQTQDPYCYYSAQCEGRQTPSGRWESVLLYVILYLSLCVLLYVLLYLVLLLVLLLLIIVSIIIFIIVIEYFILLYIFLFFSY